MPLKWKVFSGRDRKKDKTVPQDISEENVRSIVTHEISNVSARTQIMKYFDETDAKLNELCTYVKEINAVSSTLENSIHKDNLLSYQNTKNVLDAMEENNRIRAGKLRHAVIASLLFAVAAFAGVAFIIIKMYI